MIFVFIFFYYYLNPIFGNYVFHNHIEYNQNDSFMLPIYVKDFHGSRLLCNGLIVRKDFILTTAKCVHKRSENDIFIVDSSNKLSVQKIIIHQLFDTNFNINNIALIKLKKIRFLNINSDIISKRFAINSTAYSNIYSWNYLNNRLIFKYIPVESILSEEERNLLSFPYETDNNNICVRTKVNHVTEYGDNGAVLLDSNKKYVGILSISNSLVQEINCFLKISHYTQWIRKIMFTI